MKLEMITNQADDDRDAHRPHHHPHHHPDRHPNHHHHHHHHHPYRSNLSPSSSSSHAHNPPLDHDPVASSRHKRTRTAENPVSEEEDMSGRRGGGRTRLVNKRRRSSNDPEAPPREELDPKPADRWILTMMNEDDEEEYDGQMDPNGSCQSSSAFHASTSSQSSDSPLPPKTPDLSHSSNYPWSVESNERFKQSRPDEIELLSAIEKQAETYTSEIRPEQVLFAARLHHPRRRHPAELRLLDRWELGDDSPKHEPIRSPRLPAQLVFDRHLVTPHIAPAAQDKPFKCSLCPKSFTRNYDLTRHKSSHQDQRQHSCAKCGRSFNRRDALIRHGFVKGCVPTT